MNAPSAHERFYLEGNTEKVVYLKDQKIPHAAQINVRREDHTLGNVIRCQLLNNPSVLFAGYRMPHPLEYELQFRVQTDGSKSPGHAVIQAIDELETQINTLETKMKKAIADKKKQSFYR